LHGSARYDKYNVDAYLWMHVFLYSEFHINSLGFKSVTGLLRSLKSKPYRLKSKSSRLSNSILSHSLKFLSYRKVRERRSR
jgi:hypothetical protein